MDKELQVYYENRFSMFSEQGWKDLMEDIDARIAAINTLSGVETIETLYSRKGELDCLMWLRTLPDVSKDTYDSLNNEQNVA